MRLDLYTPIETRTGQRAHATPIPFPCGRDVPTACGRRVHATASYRLGTFPDHVKRTIPGHDPGACLPCTRALGLTPLIGMSRRGGRR